MNRHLRRAARSRQAYHTPSEEHGGNLPRSYERLDRLLREAREAYDWMAGRGAEVPSDTLQVLRALGPVARVQRLDRIEVYQVTGGYQADVIFKGVSVGALNRVGTSAASPVATYAEAERMAGWLLYALLDLERMRAEQEPSPCATFMFFGNPVRVSLEDLAAIEALPGYQRLTETEAVAQINRAFQTPVSLSRNGWDEEPIVGFGFDEAWMWNALIAGVTAYPTASGAGTLTWASGSKLH